MIVAIDGNNLAWRIYHTMGGLTHKGKPTGVQYGVLTQAIKIIEHYQPESLVFAWDSKGSFRRKMYPDYKAKRDTDDPEERKMRNMVKKEIQQLKHHVLPEIGWTNQIWQAGCEADDILAKLTHIVGPEKEIKEMVIVTADDDLLQCIRPSVTIDNPSQKRVITDEKFQSEYGIIPFQYRKVKAIAGCNSDNIPGVPGVGEKTALKFLRNELSKNSKKYQEIYKHYVQDTEWLSFQQKLVCLPHHKTKQPEINLHDRIDLEALLHICEDRGFHSLLKRTEWKKLRKVLKD